MLLGRFRLDGASATWTDYLVLALLVRGYAVRGRRRDAATEQAGAQLPWGITVHHRERCSVHARASSRQLPALRARQRRDRNSLDSGCYRLAQARPR